MALSSCPRCKKMFNKTDKAQVCTSCEADEAADFAKVRAALDLEPGLTGEDAAKKADVPLAVVHRMLKEGTLAIVNPMDKIICGRCGQNPAISAAKRLCETCLDKLNAEVAKATAEIKLNERKQAQVGEYLSARRAFEERGR